MRFINVPVDYKGRQRRCRKGLRKAAEFLVEHYDAGIGFHEQVQRGYGLIFPNPSGLFIDHALSDDECLVYVAEYWRTMAWSRLPALILLPDGRDELQVKLVANGAR